MPMQSRWAVLCDISWMGLKKGGQMILTALDKCSSLYVLSFNTPMTEILDCVKETAFSGIVH